MTIAINEKRTILTFDRNHGELIFHYNYKPEMGVIYLRLSNYKPNEPGVVVENIVNNSEIDLSNALTVVDDNGIWQRKY